LKTLIYIGNKEGIKKEANLSSIDVLGRLLDREGYKVYSASKKKNILFRLFDMLWVCLKYRGKADYVLIDTYSTLNFYYTFFVSQLCRVLKLKYIPILHGGNLSNRLKKSPKLSKSIFNNSYINVAPSMYTKSNFEALGFDNITYIPNTIEVNNYAFKERSFNTIKLLWVRSFSRIYNPVLAVEVLKALKDKNIHAALCMVGPDGDGSLSQVKKHAEQLGVKVDFKGKLTKQEWIKLSDLYNVFINTTNFDNMPVSVIEAMALGLPVVSTNVGGLPFLIEHKKNGFLVATNGADEFVRMILEIADSNEKTNKITKEARNFVEQFDWENVKKHWIKLLK
jgi:glycosyltransferase involved in cell wall biosynthesis